MVSDWWRHLRKHLGINALNHFMCQWMGSVTPGLSAKTPLTHQAQEAAASQLSLRIGPSHLYPDFRSDQGSQRWTQERA